MVAYGTNSVGANPSAWPSSLCSDQSGGRSSDIMMLKNCSQVAMVMN